jgi:predicted dehydrogenase
LTASVPPKRVGLIGFGYSGRSLHTPLIRATPGLALVAVASQQSAAVSQALGSGISVHSKPSALIARDDIDLVVIATPNDTHHPLARKAILADKAVVVDKPFALDATQALDLVNLARERGRLLSVFHNRRWDGDFLTVRDLLARGDLGRVTHAHLQFDRFRPQVRERWRESGSPGGGLWTDLGPHLIDQAIQLFGEPVAIDADIASMRDNASGDDWFQATLRYAGELRVTLSATTLAAAPGPRFTLHGTRGSYVKHSLDKQEEALKAGAVPGSAGWGQDDSAGQLVIAHDPAQPDALTTTALPNRAGCYTAYYTGIAQALAEAGPNPVPAEEAMIVMRWLDLGRASGRLHRELPRLG